MAQHHGKVAKGAATTMLVGLGLVSKDGGGFGARRILVGDLMNWGSVIPGTGTFHAKLTQLEKKLQLRRPVESLGQGMNRVVKLAAKRLRDDPAVPALTQAEKLGV